MQQLYFKTRLPPTTRSKLSSIWKHWMKRLPIRSLIIQSSFTGYLAFYYPKSFCSFLGHTVCSLSLSLNHLQVSILQPSVGILKSNFLDNFPSRIGSLSVYLSNAMIFHSPLYQGASAHEFCPVFKRDLSGITHVQHGIIRYSFQHMILCCTKMSPRLKEYI